LPLLAVLLAVALVLYADPAWAQETAEKVAKKSTVRSQLFTPFFYTRLITNLVSVVVLVMFVYLPIHRKKDYFFTFLILNFLVFIITFLINKTNAFSSMGTAFGLLAFFSLLRLRTETITMKDMTYLFVVLTIGLVNATMNGPLYELIALDLVIVAITFGLDKEWLSKSIHVREILLDNLDHVVPESKEKLIAELRTRTGLEIQRIRIQSVDLVKKRAVIQIYYY
jgi:hypothetical protein